jgi:hypothetical protein
MPHKNIDTDRSTGGPGSSRHDAGEERRDPDRRRDDAPAPGEPTNPQRSRVSGGGGERDRHHSHDSRNKS